jgi:hypothetical protein
MIYAEYILPGSSKIGRKTRNEECMDRINAVTTKVFALCALFFLWLD